MLLLSKGRINLTKLKDGGRWRTLEIVISNIKGLAIFIFQKFNVYNACVLTALLYGSEGWSTYEHQLRRLNGFHCRCLRKILGIKWYHRVTNVEVLARASSDSIHTHLSRRRLRWIGHVKRMDDNRIPKKIFYGEIRRGKRKVGRRRNVLGG